jgi:hypothetical protein
VLDVDRLQPRDWPFGGHEVELISRARTIKAEGLAHAVARTVPPTLTLTRSAPKAAPGSRRRPG